MEGRNILFDIILTAHFHTDKLCPKQELRFNRIQTEK